MRGAILLSQTQNIPHTLKSQTSIAEHLKRFDTKIRALVIVRAKSRNTIKNY
jgi:hypothetical protein